MSTAELDHSLPSRNGLVAGAASTIGFPTVARQVRRRRFRDVVVLDPAPEPLHGDEQLVVCLPTYDEAANIERMLRALVGTLGAAARILVVDDGSPDGTADIAARVGAELGAVEVMRRHSKDGLGRAYVAGLARALELGAQLVVQMDCDFSHDPGDVLRLATASRHADLVIGSRYVPGGRVVNWPRRRLALSRGGSLYARKMLGLPVSDLTGGFKCWRRQALEALELEAVRTSGYGFQIEMTHTAASLGYQLAEIPITFTERTAGESKMSPAIALEAMREVPGLRWRSTVR